MKKVSQRKTAPPAPAPPAVPLDVVVHKQELVELSTLKDHPRNYRGHPDDQVEHLVGSLSEHGFYRNVVIARDGTVLAGHGVIKAARAAGLKEAPAIRLDLLPDDPRALKILTGDNELSRIAEIDDRGLSELLKEIKDHSETGLLGTGYDEQMLAALVMVTRHADEIKDAAAAAEWVGLPAYDPSENRPQLLISFPTEAAREQFMQWLQCGPPTYKHGRVWSLRWPPEGRHDWAALQFKATPTAEKS